MSEPGYMPPDLTLFGEEHIRRYLETDGAVGHEWNGAPTLCSPPRDESQGSRAARR
jgi:hypothetical protein